MAYDFLNKVSFTNMMNTNLLALGAKLNPEDVTRLSEYFRKWNFYEGYHWEELPPSGKTEITKNYCRVFADKFVAFEFGKGFNIRMKPDVEEYVLPFLNEVWDDNNKEQFCLELGQSKSVTGDAWVYVNFQPKYDEDGNLNPDFYDPYNEYEKGKIIIKVLPPNICFPEYDDDYDREKLTRFKIMYPVRLNPNEPSRTRLVIYTQEWDTEKVVVYRGRDLIGQFLNKYGIIPFFHCKNLPIVGKNFGKSDLDDIIPLNVELNLKSSDISEIIDYHSAPITVVYGAKVDKLIRGANKVWGGLPKDGKVENLELKSDLSASNNYITDLKLSLHEIGGIPDTAFGNNLDISNTSGVALQIMLMSLLERVRMKRIYSSKCLKEINKFIIKIGLEEGLIDSDLSKWQRGDIYSKDLFYNEIIWEDVLPKDALVELQAIQLEMKMGLENREGALKRLGRKDIQKKIQEIDEDRRNYPDIYGISTKENNLEGKNNLKRSLNENKNGEDSQVNAGFTNSPEKKVDINS